MLLENSSKPSRYIALVDCNNFYASCERLFKPAWRTKPVGVLSNNDGCIVARSNELKAAGIPMGAPYFKYKKQLQAMGAEIVSSNYELYGDMSARVMSTLEQLAPDVEVYSVDEAWLHLEGFESSSFDAYCADVVTKTTQYTGIPVSMGVAPTKVLAKLASHICKKRGLVPAVFRIDIDNSLDEFLEAIKVGDVWGIGRRWAKSLNEIGICTALELKNYDTRQARTRYNVVMERIIRELRGESCIEKENIEPKKQIIASRSFGNRVEDRESLVQSVSLHASRAAEKLRAQDSVCGVMQVFIRTSPFAKNEQFYSNAIQVRFDPPTSDTRLLIGAARAGISRIFRSGKRYAKAGVTLNDITQESALQKNLFSDGDSTKSIELMQAIDAINNRYSKRTAFFASQSTNNKAWAMQRGRMTQAYTTRFDELMLVG